MSRKNQIQRKETLKSAKAKENAEFSEFWKLRNQELQIAEAQEKEDTRQRQMAMNNYL